MLTKTFNLNFPFRFQLKRHFPSLYVLSFDLLIRDQPSVTIRMAHDKFGAYNLKYSSTKTVPIQRAGRTITLGFGMDGKEYSEGTWKSFTRNLLNDLTKGLPNDLYPKSLKQSQAWKVEALDFDGVGCITNISLSKGGHFPMFYFAAKWLLDNQNPKTGVYFLELLLISIFFSK